MPKRVDANQSAIVETARAIGASVQHLHMVGRGCPDLIIGFQGINYLVEIKDGSKPPSKRKLTPDEETWHLTWCGQVDVVENEVDLLELIGAL